MTTRPHTHLPQLYRDLDPEKFETFLKAATTLFQVAAGDAWISTVVRPLSELHGDDQYDISYPFFMSYYFLSSIVLFNIIVAVLLDGWCYMVCLH